MPAVAPIIGNIAINLAIGVGASLLANVFRPQQAQKTQQVTARSGLSVELEVGEAVAVSGIFGLGRASGQLLFINEFGENNEFVQFVIKTGHGWHDGLQYFLVDEKPVTLAGSNADPRGQSVAEFTREGTPYLWVKHYTGAPGQTADAELVAQSNPTGRWTANHKVSGCAYMIITCRYDETFFGNTIPRFGSVWRGLRLHDWRVPGAVWGDQATYVFSSNPVVIRYNFRRGIWSNGVRLLGQGFSSLSCDLAGYTAAANRCDETFYDPISDTTFPVFSFGRQISDDEEKLAVLRQLEDAYCGSSFKRGGADVPLPAQQMVPALTLADIDRVLGQPIRADRKGSVSQKRTMWHGQFISQDLAWAEAPFTPRIDVELESLIGGRRAAVMNQPYEHVQTRAQLRAEIALRRQLYPAMRVETFTPKALVLEPGDAFTRQSEWGSTLMIVERADPLPDKSGVTITMTEWHNSIVPASGDSFVDLPAEPGASQSPADRTIAVSGLNVTAYSRESGGAVLPFLKATWTPITDPNVDQVMIRIWPVAGTEANDREDFFASAKLASTRLCGPVAPATDYTGYALPIRRDGRITVPTNPFLATSGALTVPLDIPDNSVGIEKLVQEARNRLDGVVGDIPARIAQLEREQAEQASAGFTDSTTNRKRSHVLAAAIGKSIAAVIREEAARVEDNAAFAMALTQVVAQIENSLATGLISFDVVASETGVSSAIALMTAIEHDGDRGEGGLYVKTYLDAGVIKRDLLINVDRLLVTDGINTSNAFRFDAATGSLVLKELRFELLKSLDGTTVTIDGLTGMLDAAGDFSFG
ncbi:hypothetical protein PSC71_08420 [Devosia sp. J2-20]|uniref:hypothetical protein n=1 Tax=Devosia sp. J2-20 TaxID=3026161 RepID=UPI00249A8981|nr:hypothetical protein [Devosia sp. J2-20]WDR00758.1 hypothetical protein PSC71_08420 [Devosia sp. J2-20]